MHAVHAMHGTAVEGDVGLVLPPGRSTWTEAITITEHAAFRIPTGATTIEGLDVGCESRPCPTAATLAKLSRHPERTADMAPFSTRVKAGTEPLELTLRVEAATGGGAVRTCRLAVTPRRATSAPRILTLHVPKVLGGAFVEGSVAYFGREPVHEGELVAIPREASTVTLHHQPCSGSCQEVAEFVDPDGRWREGIDTCSAEIRAGESDVSLTPVVDLRAGAALECRVAYE